MANLIETTQRMFDLFESARRPGLCEECLHSAEPFNETEMLPGGRADWNLCRDCYAVVTRVVAA